MSRNRVQSSAAAINGYRISAGDAGQWIRGPVIGVIPHAGDRTDTVERVLSDLREFAPIEVSIRSHHYRPVNQEDITALQTCRVIGLAVLQFGHSRYRGCMTGIDLDQIDFCGVDHIYRKIRSSRG